MRFRCFGDIEDVREELQAADIVFLLPHQAELLAAKSVDLFVNISSLHEMTKAQVSVYFRLIDRLTRGHFYTKQWKNFVNERDGIAMAETDYPYEPRWKRVLRRTARAQPAFFEALYQLGVE